MTELATTPGGGRLDWEDYLLLSTIVLLPWAFGGVEIWAFRSAAFLIALSAAIALMRDGAAGWGLADRRAFWLLPAFLLGLWGLLQVTPLPPQLLQLLSPTAHQFHVASSGGLAALEDAALQRVPEASAHPFHGGAEEKLEIAVPACMERSWRTLSLQPSATGERLGWYVALLLAFLLVRRRTARSWRHAVYLGALLVTFAALALFGLIQDQTWNGKIFWLREPRSASLPFGPYVNPNHFVGVMELAVAALAAFGWSRLRRSGRAALYQASFAGAGIAGVACVLAGLASASKLGAVLIAVELLVLVAIGARTLRARLWLVGIVLLLAASVTGLLLESDLGTRVASYVARAEGGDLLEGREAIWLAGGAMFRDFPLTGAGFGAFQEVFLRYTPPGALARYAQAHNDYLEVLLDGGLIAIVLIAWLVVAFALRVRKGLRTMDDERRLVAIGMLIGVLAMSIHAFFEFPHQMPANALLFVTMCALLVPAGGSAETVEHR
jgi:O-antigen ligase